MFGFRIVNQVGHGGEDGPEVFGVVVSHGPKGLHVLVGSHHGENRGGDSSVRLVESVGLLRESGVPAV